MDTRSPKRVRLEIADEDSAQDDSDFYSESGSPEKKQQLTDDATAISDSKSAIPSIAVDIAPATSPIPQIVSASVSSIPGLGADNDTRSLKREYHEMEQDDEEKEEDDDLYDAEVANGVDNGSQTAEHTASGGDDDLGLTPESTADAEIVPLHVSNSSVTANDISTTTTSLVQHSNSAHVVNSDKTTEDEDVQEQLSAVVGASAIPSAPVDPEATTAEEPDKDHNNPEWRFDSSDAQSSSSEDSSDDSEDDSDDDGILLNAEEQARILMQEAADGDDATAVDGPLKTANEQTEQFVAKPDIIVTDEMKILELGVVDKIVSNLAVIKANTSGEYRVLEAGSVLCLENRIVVGAISETLGRVQEPRYTVGFASAQALVDDGIALGTKLFFVEPHSSFVFTQPLRFAKGTDASNIHDEEVPEAELEFSDDEKEAEVKKAAKQAKKDAREGREPISRPPPMGPSNRGRNTSQIPTGPRVQNRPSSAPRKTHPDNVSDQNYSTPINYDDDEDEDMYKPLKRPDNLHEMMSSGPPPPAAAPRGRGNFANRGGRGKGQRGDHQDRGRAGFSNRGGRGGHKNWKDNDRRVERELSASWSSQGGRQSKSPQPPREKNNQFQQQQNPRQHSNASPYQGQSNSHGKQSQHHKQGSKHHDQYQHEPASSVSEINYSSSRQFPSQHQHQQPMHAHQYSHTQQPSAPIPVPPQFQNYVPAPPPLTKQTPQPNVTMPNIPPGAHVNPAFFMLQQLAQAQVSTPSPPPPPPPPPPPQQSYAINPAGGGVNLQHLQQLAALLQGQQQQSTAPPPPTNPASNPQQYAGWTGYTGQQQHSQQQYQQGPSSRDEDRDSREAQERLNALMNNYRPTDPRR